MSKIRQNADATTTGGLPLTHDVPSRVRRELLMLGSDPRRSETDLPLSGRLKLLQSQVDDFFKLASTAPPAQPLLEETEDDDAEMASEALTGDGAVAADEGSGEQMVEMKMLLGVFEPVDVAPRKDGVVLPTRRAEQALADEQLRQAKALLEVMQYLQPGNESAGCPNDDDDDSSSGVVVDDASELESSTASSNGLDEVPRDENLLVAAHLPAVAARASPINVIRKKPFGRHPGIQEMD